MTINRNNFIIIQMWMITDLHLRGNSLMLYAFLYSFGQGNSGFQGSDLELRQFVAPLIHYSSFYKALNDLVESKLVSCDGVFIKAIVPENIPPVHDPQSRIESKNETLPSKNETPQSKNETDSFYNKDKKDKKGSAPQKSQFSDPNELAKRIEYRRLHGFR